MSRIFINYRRQDSEGYVGRLYDHLARVFEPDDIFMDVSSIEPGADFVVVLEDAAVVLYSATQRDTLRRDFEKLKLFI